MKVHKEQLKEILAQGPASTNEIAKLFNCSSGAVYYAIKKLGLYQGRKPSVKSRQHPSTRIIKVIADIIKSEPTESMSNIARRNNCSREYVSQIAGQLRTEGVIK
jgi:DNA-binding Lrp family transcriptional regulator